MNVDLDAGLALCKPGDGRVEAGGILALIVELAVRRELNNELRRDSGDALAPGAALGELLVEAVCAGGGRLEVSGVPLSFLDGDLGTAAGGWLAVAFLGTGPGATMLGVIFR